MSTHILYDSTIGELNQPCCICLHPSTHCILRVSCQSGDMYQIDLSHSSCMHIINNLSKQTFNYLLSAVPTTQSPSTNVPIQCPLCDVDQPYVWRYNMVMHLCCSHQCNADQLVSQFSISEKEKTLMKTKWDSIQKALKAPQHRTKKSKGRMTNVMKVLEAHSSQVVFEYV